MELRKVALNPPYSKFVVKRTGLADWDKPIQISIVLKEYETIRQQVGLLHELIQLAKIEQISIGRMMLECVKDERAPPFCLLAVLAAEKGFQKVLMILNINDIHISQRQSLDWLHSG